MLFPYISCLIISTLKDGEGDGGGGDSGDGGDGIATATAMTVGTSPATGKDDREHSGRAHQANSRTHTHNVYTSLFCLLVRSLTCSRPSARACRHDVTKKKRKEETPRKRRHQALRASSLSASSCTTRTYPRIPLGETRRKTSGESALSLSRISRVPPCRAANRARARTMHPFVIYPYRSLLLSFANPRQPLSIHSSRPPLYLLFSIHVSILCQLSFSLSRDARSSSFLSLRNLTNPFYRECPPTLSLSLSLSLYLSIYLSLYLSLALSLSLFLSTLVPAERDL